MRLNNSIRKELTNMSIITRSPHSITTKLYSVKFYRSGATVQQVIRRYHISKASLMRWNKLYDGTRESLLNKPKTPKTKHPNAHTEFEIRNINNLIRRNPNISYCELYGKLKRNYNYKRNPASLFRFLRKQGFYKSPTPYKKRKNKKYDTPKEIGIKWQIDVKYVPLECNTTNIRNSRMYQYTCIDEASRVRFLYWYEEQCISNSIDFVKRCIEFYSYKPQIIQTDNGAEFTITVASKKTAAFTSFLKEQEIEHKRIRPRTPRHNGKVERSHRNDNNRFYNTLKFYSLDDLRNQGKTYLKRSNDIPMSVLNYNTPNEQEAIKI